MPFFKRILQKFLSIYHYFFAFFSALFYFFPSRRIKVIGVTGTKGKSSTLEFLSRIFEEAGFKVALFSSMKIKIDREEKPNLYKMTMPGRGVLQRFLKKATKKGCQFALIEVTSEGILQHRHKFINFDGAIFVNLSPEHIERHGSFEAYREAKGKLFLATKNIHVLNFDDPNFSFYFKFKAKRKIIFTTKKEISAFEENVEVVQARDIEIGFGKTTFFIKDTFFKLNLFGDFFLENALAAISMAYAQGVSLGTCAKALKKIKNLPGRMEIVISKPFLGIIDYAHTPDSLLKVYQYLSKLKTQNSRMICVLGAAGGGRDRWKRPEMGKIAAKFCDYIILTNEDPYDEDPLEILKDIEKGILSGVFKKQLTYEKILSRKKAIEKGVSIAQKGDVLIITGKGSEPWMCIKGGKKIPWDDRKILKEALLESKKF